MTAALVTPPAIEPVTVAEAKAHLRLDHDADDALLGALVGAARCHVEALARQVLIEQTWRIYRDAWPRDGVVPIALGPLRSVAAVTVYDAAGEPVTLDPAGYDLDAASRPARLTLRGTPPAPGRRLNGVEIDVVAGYGPTGVAVPAPLRQAILMLVARWYEDREGAALGGMPAPVADEVAALVAPYRAARLA